MLNEIISNLSKFAESVNLQLWLNTKQVGYDDGFEAYQIVFHEPLSGSYQQYEIAPNDMTDESLESLKAHVLTNLFEPTILS